MINKIQMITSNSISFKRNYDSYSEYDKYRDMLNRRMQVEQQKSSSPEEDDSYFYDYSSSRKSHNIVSCLRGMINSAGVNKYERLRDRVLPAEDTVCQYLDSVGYAKSIRERSIRDFKHFRDNFFENFPYYCSVHAINSPDGLAVGQVFDDYDRLLSADEFYAFKKGIVYDNVRFNDYGPHEASAVHVMIPEVCDGMYGDLAKAFDSPITINSPRFYKDGSLGANSVVVYDTGANGAMLGARVFVSPRVYRDIESYRGDFFLDVPELYDTKFTSRGHSMKRYLQDANIDFHSGRMRTRSNNVLVFADDRGRNLAKFYGGYDERTNRSGKTSYTYLDKAVIDMDSRY